MPVSHAGAASLHAGAALAATAIAGPDPAALWNAYLTAQAAWYAANQAACEASASGGTDGTYGFYYGAAYEAENAMQLAYEAWLAAAKAWNQNVALV